MAIPSQIQQNKLDWASDFKSSKANYGTPNCTAKAALASSL